MKRELQVITLIGYCLLLPLFGYLLSTEDWRDALQWMIQAGLLWEFVLWQVEQRLYLNRFQPEAPLYNTLGWGNRLTILRGLLIAMTGGFILFPHGASVTDLLPALFYTLAAILDRFDGYVARKTQQVTLLGNELDISFDALGLVIAPLLAFSLGSLHSSYLLLSMAFYIYRWGLNYRSKRNLMIITPPPNTVRRTLAGFQMSLLAVLLWPIFQPPFTIILGISFMLPVLFGFIVDWWIVCGLLKPDVIMTIDKLSYQYFQPLLRLVLVLVLAIIGFKMEIISQLDHLNMMPTIVFVLGLSLALTGFAGRIGALLLLVLLGLYFDPIATSMVGTGLIVTLSWLLLLGTGRFSVWQWDDAWVKRYDGA